MQSVVKFWVALAGLALACPVALRAADEPRRILLLHSYHQGFEWSDDITRGVRATLTASGVPFDLQTEYLDARHRDLSPAYLARFTEFLRLRHSFQQPNLIIAADDPIVKLLLQEHDAVFPGVPMIACGVNEVNGSSDYLRRAADERDWLAGVLEVLPVERAGTLVLQLRPQARQLVTVGEGPEAHYEQELQRLQPKLAVHRLDVQQKTLEELGGLVSRLPDDAVVLLTPLAFDSNGRKYSMSEVALYLSGRSRVPVLGMHKNLLGNGIVGGALNDGFQQGRQATEMALAVVRGATPSSLGVQRGTISYQFDDVELRRWHIAQASLPPASEVINRPITLYERYRELWLLALTFCVAQSVIISLLVLNVRRRQKAQEALARREAELRLIMDQVPAFISYIGRDLRYVRMNVKYAEMLGRPIEQLVGRTTAEVMGAEYHQKVRGYLERARSGEAVTFETTVKFDDGSDHFVVVTYTPDRSPRGHVRGIVVLVHDITERKKAEELAARQTAELERSNADLQQFAYVASHDLQEPLRTVSNFSQMVRRRYKGQLDQSADEFLDYIVGGAQRMELLIRDLLAYSRVVNKDSTSETVSMQDAMDWATENLRVALEDSGGTITYEALPMVKGDHMRLVQLLQNLVGNALKYSLPDLPPRVTVSAERHGDNSILFCVADNGQGFEPRFAERIFGVFKRLHGPEVAGTGMGLAICRKIVERHGGRIWAEGQPGEGARFYFTLNAAEKRSAVSV